MSASGLRYLFCRFGVVILTDGPCPRHEYVTASTAALSRTGILPVVRYPDRQNAGPTGKCLHNCEPQQFEAGKEASISRCLCGMMLKYPGWHHVRHKA